ncbi:MAG: endonuclease/exonuclease/phosphatase family protein, partial [Muribaculaceae bacterium]|nr:endonuclease/exonuclease/phosphatase family protein [Muribaculaceae bacterium]
MTALKYAFAAMLAIMSAEVSAQSLRVMSYNVRNGVGMDDVRDYDRAAGVIDRLRPDVVAVQEVDSATGRSSGRYVLGEFAQRTSMYPLYAPAISYDGGSYGIGLLSRHRPKAVKRIALPGSEESRALLIADFGDYAVACTHLSLTEADALSSAALISEEAAA